MSAAARNSTEHDRATINSSVKAATLIAARRFGNTIRQLDINASHRQQVSAMAQRVINAKKGTRVQMDAEHTHKWHT